MAAIQRAARRVAPAELFAAAILDGVTVPGKKLGNAQLSEVYADGDALLAAVSRGEQGAIAAAMRGLARLDGEHVVEAALAFASEGKGELRRAATFALARSQSADALELLLAALEPGSSVPRGALDRSVHPDATVRVRSILTESGVTMFAVRPRPDLAQWRELSRAEQHALTGMQPHGAPTPDLQRAQNAISVLGARGDVESIEVLIRIFESHPDDRLRIRSAHALAGIPDPRAYAALDRRWADADSSISTIAVRAALMRDPMHAWDRFAPHVTRVVAKTATHVDHAIVASLFYVLHGGVSPRKVPVASDPLVLEPRFIELAAELRHDRDVGEAARMLLEIVPRDQVLAAIEKHPRAVPIVVPVALPARRDFLARYQAGDHAAWDELVASSDAVVQHAELAEEAFAVAAALMKRVRHNTDSVRAILRAAGATLAVEDAPATDAALAPLIAVVGPLPVALDAFWRVVGSIALVPGGATRYDYGTCSLEIEGISLLALDPLEVCGPEVGWIIDAHQQRIAESHPEIVGGLCLDFAPDFLHKQNISGGPAYSIELPPPSSADAVDPAVLYERHRTTFVGYLRAAFAGGGFPLLDVAWQPVDKIDLNDRIAFQSIKGAWSPPAERLRSKLCRDLIPF